MYDLVSVCPLPFTDVILFLFFVLSAHVVIIPQWDIQDMPVGKSKRKAEVIVALYAQSKDKIHTKHFVS